MPGHLVVSLDFELHWGLRDHTSVSDGERRLRGVWTAIPALLSLFADRGIRATWATVGMLMAEDRDELESVLPRVRPRYTDPRLDPYAELPTLGRNEQDDPFHYAPSLVRLIADTPGQEIGTHTFSHFYTLEAGADLDAFVADLGAARALATRRGLSLRSIVFPRNQYSPEHLRLLPGLGITAYRGASTGSFYRPAPTAAESRPRRALRLLDTYLPLTGSNVRHTARHPQTSLVDVPSSRFLRPYSPTLRHLDPLRLRRIELGLQAAARTGGDYHLWWHPHNHGVHLAENLSFLCRVLDKFEALRHSHGMSSAHISDRGDAHLS
jgi:peptidoglycan/xylan/chitin deacetylase (PgdA/CDA1 family)